MSRTPSQVRHLTTLNEVRNLVETLEYVLRAQILDKYSEILEIHGLYGAFGLVMECP